MLGWEKSTELTEGCLISKWCNIFSFQMVQLRDFQEKCWISRSLESVRRWRHTPPSQTDWCASIMLCCWLNAGHQSLHACRMTSTYFANKSPLLDLFWMSLAWSKHWSWLWSSNKNAFTGSWIEFCSIINCRSNWISVEAKFLQYHMSVSQMRGFQIKFLRSGENLWK